MTGNYEQLQAVINILADDKFAASQSTQIPPVQSSELYWQSRIVKLIKSEKTMLKSDLFAKAKMTYGLPDDKVVFDSVLVRLAELQYLNFSEDTQLIEYLV